MTAYELRRHLAGGHDVRLSGLDYGTMLTIHDVEHRGGHSDHQHEDGPGSDTWAQECEDFGCHGGASVVLEYTVLLAIVLLAAWIYWTAR